LFDIHLSYARDDAASDAPAGPSVFVALVLDHVERPTRATAP
jgi:hypothetical protein